MNEIIVLNEVNEALARTAKLKKITDLILQNQGIQLWEDPLWVEKLNAWCDEYGLNNLPRSKDEWLELKRISEWNEYLDELPEEIGNLKNLTYLNLKNLTFLIWRTSGNLCK